jgi:hypothetical protein
MHDLPWRAFACPGCGRGVRLRGSSNVSIEWECLPDGRYLGYVESPGSANFHYEVEFETDSGVRTGSGGGQSVDPANFPPEAIEMIQAAEARGLFKSRSNVHECSFGGTANDRAVLAPEPPSRESSVARSPFDDAP